MDLQKEINYLRLPDKDTISALNGYKALLISLVNKKLISITTIGGLSNYLCNSALEEIELKNEICYIINLLVIKIPYYCVYAGIILSSMLIKMWHEPLPEYGVQNVLENLREFKTLLSDAIDILKYKNINVLSVATLQQALQNILLQESALLLSKESLNKLSFEIVKLVLSKLDSNDMLKFSCINVIVESSGDYFSTINGIICEVDDVASILINKLEAEQNDSNKILLFTESMYETDSIIFIIKLIIEEDIKLVMCQKNICNSIKLILKRNNIVAVDRIGLEIVKGIELITGCRAVYDTSSLITDNLFYVGHYSSFRLLTINGLNYIAIEKKGSPVSTLYISCRSFSDKAYLKKVCYQCIRFVRTMIASPYLLPGPIIFEEKLIYNLKNQLAGQNIMNQIITAFCNILSEIIYLYRSLKVCTCGELERFGDIFEWKKNALINSIDDIINLLSIGVILKK